MNLRTFIALIGLLPAVTAAAVPTITFDGTHVTAKGVTPGGDVACLAVWRELGDTMPRLVRWEAVARDDDGDGVVAFDLGRDVPVVSVWAIADIATGDADIVPGPEVSAQLVDAPSELASARRDGTFSFADRHAYLELLVVRPGVGAWALSTGDGGNGDDDKTPDGVIVPALAQLRPVAATAGRPGGIRGGDTLLAIDPSTFQYYTVRLGRAK